MLLSSMGRSTKANGISRKKCGFFINLKYLNGVSSLFENPRKSKNSRKNKVKNPQKF